ncbi:MAG: hypothetical protein INH43_26250 [Acidobacteriaceae bacterium]|nr:hypothetical protein [Acidobacteriaceae bacterium]
MTNEEVQAYLDDNGYPAHVVEAGAPGLVHRWNAFVAEVERGYPYRLRDYRYDLDLRGVIDLAGLAPEVAAADARLAALLTETELRIWESSAADPWWDFGYPRNAGRDFLRDLRNEANLG